MGSELYNLWHQNTEIYQDANRELTTAAQDYLDDVKKRGHVKDDPVQLVFMTAFENAIVIKKRANANIQALVEASSAEEFLKTEKFENLHDDMHDNIRDKVVAALDVENRFSTQLLDLPHLIAKKPDSVQMTQPETKATDGELVIRPEQEFFVDVLKDIKDGVEVTEYVAGLVGKVVSEGWKWWRSLKL